MSASTHDRARMPTVRDRLRALFAATTDAPQTPQPGELAIADTRRWSVATYGPQLVAFNPDELVQKKGGLDVFDAMREDDQVKPCLWLTKAAIIGPGWELETDDESDEQANVAEELWRQLTDIGFDDVLWELLSALDYGHAIAEKVYTVDGGGLRLQAIKPRAPHAIDFDQDPHGTIRWIEQQQGGMRTQMPPAKFLHFVAQPEFDNAYGRSLLREAYRPWWYKTNFTQWWAMFAEKLAIPPIIGKHPAAESNRAAAVREILAKLQAGTALTVSEGWDLTTLETSRDPRVMFESAVNHFDLRISRVLLVPEKSGFTGAGQTVGSYSLSQTQFDSYLLLLQMFRRRLERTIQRQLMPELTELLAPGAKPPQFKLLPLTEDNKQALGELWIKAVTSGAAMTGIQDENHLREMLGFPEREPVPEVDDQPRGVTTLTPLGQPLPPSPEEVELNKAKAAALGAKVAPADDAEDMAERTYNRHPAGTGDVVGDSGKDGGKFAPKDGAAGAQSLRDATGKIGYVEEHPNAIRATATVAQTLEEMRQAGYEMPHVTIMTRADIKVARGLVSDEDHGTVLSVVMPQTLPGDVDLDMAIRAAYRGNTTTESLRDIVIHEMGHVHNGNRPAVVGWANDLGIQATASKVSPYASKNANEFLAETFTRLYRGETMPKDVLALYGKLGGKPPLGGKKAARASRRGRKTRGANAS